MIKSLVCSLLLTFASLQAQADGRPHGAEVSASDSRAVRAVVEAQLNAFASEEATRAFSYAAPGIRSQFQDAALFMEMVHRQYPMLIRPASISFYQPEAADGTIVQGVQFRDRDGNLWRAVYELEQQPDKTWRISGCAVQPDQEASTT